MNITRGQMTETPFDWGNRVRAIRDAEDGVREGDLGMVDKLWFRPVMGVIWDKEPGVLCPVHRDNVEKVSW